jgi:hypothetical protein
MNSKAFAHADWLGKTHEVGEASALSQLVSKSMFFSDWTRGDFTLSNSWSCKE